MTLSIRTGRAHFSSSGFRLSTEDRFHRSPAEDIKRICHVVICHQWLKKRNHKHMSWVWINRKMCWPHETCICFIKKLFSHQKKKDDHWRLFSADSMFSLYDAVAVRFLIIRSSHRSSSLTRPPCQPLNVPHLHTVNLPNMFCRLFTWWIHEVNPTDLGDIQSGVPDYLRAVLIGTAAYQSDCGTRDYFKSPPTPVWRVCTDSY